MFGFTSATTAEMVYVHPSYWTSTQLGGRPWKRDWSGSHFSHCKGLHQLDEEHFKIIRMEEGCKSLLMKFWRFLPEFWCFGIEEINDLPKV